MEPPRYATVTSSPACIREKTCCNLLVLPRERRERFVISEAFSLTASDAARTSSESINSSKGKVSPAEPESSDGIPPWVGTILSVGVRFSSILVPSLFFPQAQKTEITTITTQKHKKLFKRLLKRFRSIKFLPPNHFLLPLFISVLA